jgi:proton-dependent oligopeptide transporter, POT family
MVKCVTFRHYGFKNDRPMAMETYGMSNNESQLRKLIYTQMWEFFSTYGMTALLVLFLTQNHHLSDKKAYLIFGSYMALLHCSSLLAARFSSRTFSHEYAVLAGGLLMALGHFIIAIEYQWSLFLALSLMIAGYGLFTPSLIALTGELKSKRSNDAKFTLYYVGQNIGSLLAPIMCGVIGKLYGWSYGFGMAGIGMLTGLCIFYTSMFHEKNRAILDGRALSLLFYTFVMVSLSFFVMTTQITGFLLISASIAGLSLALFSMWKMSAKENQKIFQLFIMMFYMMVFFSMLSQGGTSIILYFDRLIDKHVFGFEIATPMLMSIESLLMIVISPLFFTTRPNFVKSLTSVQKYIIGLSIMAMAFFVFSYGASLSVIFNKQGSLWIVVIGFFLFAIAELLIMPIGYSEVVTNTPKANLGLLLALWGIAQSISRYMAQKFASSADVTSYNVQHLKVAASIYQHAFLNFSKLLILSAASLLAITYIKRFIRHYSKKPTHA